MRQKLENPISPTWRPGAERRVTMADFEIGARVGRFRRFSTGSGACLETVGCIPHSGFGEVVP